MRKFNVVIRDTVYLLCCLLFMHGCGDRNDPPQAARVVSKKISIAKKQAPKQKPSVKKKSASKAENVAPGSAGQKSDLPPVAVLPDVKEKKYSRPPALSSLYNPKGKIDPFVPLFQEKSEETPVAKQKRRKRIPRTPLERIALNQLKLTGIILSSSGARAMLEEASGRGYVVTKGTPVGKNWGKVVEILKDRIIIEEEVEDLLGKVSLQKKEMKIQRPPGEL